MTNERKNEICDLLIEEIMREKCAYFICVLLDELGLGIKKSEQREFRSFMEKHKPKDAGYYAWWRGSEKEKRIDFLKLLKKKEWTQ